MHESGSFRAKTALATLIAARIVSSFCLGAEPSSDRDKERSSARDFFYVGQVECGIGAGILFSPAPITDPRPSYDYAVGLVNVGYVLSEPQGDSWLRGSFELVAEGFGAGIFQGHGHYVAGSTLWLKYNFVQPGWRWAPYSQCGAGVVFADIDHKTVGQTFNFNLDAGLGLRYALAQRWWFNVEYRFQHISNAGLATLNYGVNAHGPVIGFTRFF